MLFQFRYKRFETQPSQPLNRAQSLLEYVVLIGVVATAFIFISVFFKRGINGMIKVTADQIGVQANSDQFPDPKYGSNADLTRGYLVSSDTASQLSTQKQSVENFGTFNYAVDDRVETQSNSLVNLGFTNRAEQ